MSETPPTPACDPYTGCAPVDILDDASVAVARQCVRALANASDLSLDAREHTVLATSEMARNQLDHARLGEIRVRRVQRASRRGGTLAGVGVEAIDRGDGLPEAWRTLDVPGSSRGSLGVGLTSIRRNATELDVDVREGEGTRLHVRWLPDTALPRPQIGVVGEPFPGERRSGDDACWCWQGDEVLTVMVADGLGHGARAREPAQIAVQLFRDHHDRPFDELLVRFDEALQGTRGAAITVARLDRRAAEVTVWVAGNVAAQVVSGHTSRRCATQPKVVGDRRSRHVKVKPQTVPMVPGDLLVVATDGLRDRLDPVGDRDLLRGHPIDVADGLLRRYRRDQDDALVLTVR